MKCRSFVLTSYREQNKYMSNLLFVPLNREYKCSILSIYSRLCVFAQKRWMVHVYLLKIQWSQLSEGKNAAQTETESLCHILSRDLYLDSVIPCQYLQLVCEEDAQNMLRSEQWEVLPRSSNKEKWDHIWLLMIVTLNRIKDNLVHLNITALHSLSKRNQNSQIISAFVIFLPDAKHLRIPLSL